MKGLFTLENVLYVAGFNRQGSPELTETVTSLSEEVRIYDMILIHAIYTVLGVFSAETISVEIRCIWRARSSHNQLNKQVKNLPGRL